MKTHLSEDTDDENCDDPIRLFDNEINTVYFGSKPPVAHGSRETESRWALETIGNDGFSEPRPNSTLGRPDNGLIQTLQSGETSECNISPSCVKLVDCGKFPSYFKKYTRQIMQKLNSNEYRDSEHEIDIEDVVDDSDDCFIVEDLQQVTNEIITNDQNCIKPEKSVGSSPKRNKCIELIKRHKDDKEILKALSQKNVVKVDFKRNVGLVGLKIKQKIGISTTLDVKTHRENVVEKADAKQKCVMADEKYLSAADKMLGNIGTQLIPITDERESNTTQCKINNENDFSGKATLVKSSSSINVPVQFHISKISDKLIDNLLKSKKTNDQSFEDKIVGKIINKSLLNNPENKLNIVNEKKISPKVTITEKFTNSSTKVPSHVKNVKITNKYKNDQIKLKNSANHSTLVGLLVKDKTKEVINEIKCTKQKRRDGAQITATKLNKKPRKKIEKQKREPKSPILRCSTIPKKSKHEIPPKCNKADTNSNLLKESSKIKKIVDRLSHLNNCNLIHETNRPKHVIPKVAPVTKSLDVTPKQLLQKEPCAILDKTASEVSNIHTKSMIVPNKLSKNSNEVGQTDFNTSNFHYAQIMPASQTNTYEQHVLHETNPDCVNKHTKHDVPVTKATPKAPVIKNYKPTVSNGNVSTTTVLTPTSGSKSGFSTQYAKCPTYHGPHFPTHNALPSRPCSNNISNNNINVPVQNRCAPAIILKSNHQPNFPFENFREPPMQTMAPRPERPRHILTHITQRFRDPQPPYPIFYPPAPPSVRPQGYYSCPTNSVPNQFHPPPGHIAQQPSNPMQDLYRGCWLPRNLAHPPPPPPPPSVPPTNIPPRNIYDENKYKDCSYLNRPSVVMQNPQSISYQNSVNTLPTKNSSIIGKNNDGLVKKINIVAMSAKTKVETKNWTDKVEEIPNSQIMSPLENTEVVATKTEMLKELDKLSFVDENVDDFKQVFPAKIISEDKKENTLELAIMSEKPGRYETLKLTMNNKDNPMESCAAKGYSPPILPIPTYEKVLDRVTSNSQILNTAPKIALRPGDPRSSIRNETKPMRKRDFVKCYKRKLDNAWSNDEDSRKKDDAKKISLDEYKKRILNNDCKSEHNKKTFKDKYNTSGKRPNIEFKFRKNVDYGTETDLGYDSDSTVVL